MSNPFSIQKETNRGYNDTWNSHCKNRIGDLTFSQPNGDVAFRMLKDFGEQDDLNASICRFRQSVSEWRAVAWRGR